MEQPVFVYRRDQVLCECPVFCQGRKEGIVCRARDPWWKRPCREGKCEGPFSIHCCQKPHPDAWMEDAEGEEW